MFSQERRKKTKKKKDIRPNYINLFFKVEIAELYRHTHIILADCLILYIKFNTMSPECYHGRLCLYLHIAA